MMKRSQISSFIFCMINLCAVFWGGMLEPAGAQQEVPIHLFVSVIQTPPVLTSRAAIQDLIAFSKKARVGILFVQIYRANRAWFPSKISDDSPYQDSLKKVGEDPLALLIQQAHTSGVKVYAWVNLLSLSTNKDAVLLRTYGPDILTRNTKPKEKIEDYKIDNQYFLEPGDPRIRKYLNDVIAEIASAYPSLDGFLFDYIRYPDVDPSYGYSQANVKRFEEATAVKAFTEKTESWRAWKREQVTSLVGELVATARKQDPGIGVATTGCVSYTRAYEDSFQDWPSWINKGIVDFVELMDYPDNVIDYRQYMEEAKTKVDDFRKVYMGVGAYKLLKLPEVFAQQIQAAQRSGAGAVVIFHYGNLIESPQLTKVLEDENKNNPYKE